ncbi:histidine phosphatase family protein [Desnuesiella massiliensis]|uniref:histidine phosphatase family protein n=1 Tax=Desnuesiella massiliensis TaxID=1650662 RepID=UPI0006E20FBA|nr:histidine phosphatase family protein [Desnuesiella massiliensis]
MTKVYFVRHAKPNFQIQEDLVRPLTEEGIRDSRKVTEYLIDKNITKIFSSPYKRSMDTVKDFAQSLNLNIEIIEDFRERKIDNVWIEDFEEFCQKQWKDFDYKLSEGESLREVQSRNIKALQSILKDHENQNIVIGTHGTALSTILNHYNDKFGYSEFQRIKNFMPFIVCVDFLGQEVIKVEEFNL